MKMVNFLNLIPTLMIGVSIGLIFCLFTLILPMKDKMKNLEKMKNYYDSTFLRKQGSTSTYGNGELGKDFINYDLRSWDGGKNWYAVEYNFDTKELKIIGDAELIYPKLLKHLDGWDKLEKHVKENGSIKETDTVGLKVLEEAGFTVEKKK